MRSSYTDIFWTFFTFLKRRQQRSWLLQKKKNGEKQSLLCILSVFRSKWTCSPPTFIRIFDLRLETMFLCYTENMRNLLFFKFCIHLEIWTISMCVWKIVSNNGIFFLKDDFIYMFLKKWQFSYSIHVIFLIPSRILKIISVYGVSYT